MRGQMAPWEDVTFLSPGNHGKPNRQPEVGPLSGPRGVSYALSRSDNVAAAAATAAILGGVPISSSSEVCLFLPRGSSSAGGGKAALWRPFSIRVTTPSLIQRKVN